MMSPVACIAAQMDALQVREAQQNVALLRQATCHVINVPCAVPHVQRNDYPEADAGVRTCFAFTKPEGAEQMIAASVRPSPNMFEFGRAGFTARRSACSEGQNHSALLELQALPQRARSWGAHEEWLALHDFSVQLHSPPFAALLNCDAWKVGRLP